MSVGVAILMAVIASKKGFNPLLWILAGGIPGFIILLCMPSANARGIDDDTRVNRRRRGNIVGLNYLFQTDGLRLDRAA